MAWTQEQTNASKRRNSAAKRDHLNRIKTERGCERCGLKNQIPRVYDFHHRDPSTKTIPMHRLAHDCRWDQIESEVAKCTVLCANCHRIVEHEMSD